MRELPSSCEKAYLEILEADEEMKASYYDVCAGELCRYRRPIVDFRIPQGKQNMRDSRLLC